MIRKINLCIVYLKVVTVAIMDQSEERKQLTSHMEKHMGYSNGIRGLVVEWAFDGVHRLVSWCSEQTHLVSSLQIFPAGRS